MTVLSDGEKHFVLDCLGYSESIWSKCLCGHREIHQFGIMKCALCKILQNWSRLKDRSSSKHLSRQKKETQFPINIDRDIKPQRRSMTASTLSDHKEEPATNSCISEFGTSLIGSTSLIYIYIYEPPMWTPHRSGPFVKTHGPHVRT